MALSPLRQKDRLKALMAIRVVTVTAFLGSALFVDARGLSGVSDFRDETLLGLIAGTFFLTILHALGLRKKFSIPWLATFQIVGDLIITTLLVLVTGGFDSLFIFFFHLTIINAAVVTDQRGAIYTSGATTAAMVYLATISLGWLPHPFLGTEPGSVGSVGLFYEVAINSFAGIIIAVLAGHLAARLGEATEELEQRRTDILDLQALNDNILSSLSSGLLTVSNEGTIIFFNRAAEEITALSSSEVLGRQLDHVFPNLANASTTHKISISSEPRLESLFVRPDGDEIYLGFSVSPLRDGQGIKTGKIIIFQDFSEIRKLEAQMKRSEKLAAIGQLSASIAHEIRNPLASISGSVEMLRADSEPTEENQILMNIVLREVDRLDALIRDFLAYSQPRKLTPQPTPLAEVIDEALQLFQAQPERASLHIDRHIDPTLHALIDPESLRQILWNLLKNAAEALETTSTPDIYPGQHADLLIETHIDPDRPLITLAIEDNGPGIPESRRDDVFQPFFTTKDTGTGLGLATIYRLLDEQHGHLTIDAPHHLQGARFEVLLPLASPPTHRSPQLPSSQSPQLSA